MAKHIIASAAELPPGERKIITLEGRSIGVFNANGNYYALRNRCPHQGAPLCLGSVKGMNLPSEPGEYIYGREGEILRCPWHGWEFDLTNGKSIYNPHQCLVKTYEVTVERNEDTSSEEDTESIETYPVTIESGLVVVHL